MSTRSRSAAIYRHGGGNPFYLEQLARGRGRRALDGGVGAAPTGGVPPAPSRRRSPRSSPRSRRRERALLEAAAVAGEPFEPDLAAAIAELDGGGRARRARRAARARPRAPDAGAAAVRLPPSARAPRRLRGDPGRLAARRARACRRGARGARRGPGERAHHVEQSAGQGDEEAIARPARGRRGTAAARARRRRRAGSRRRCACCRRRTIARRVDVRVSLASALRSLGELERCRATLLEAIELLPPEAADRRVELIALCAAVEHWLGRHDEAHRRLVRAWDDLPDQRSPAAATLADRAGDRRAVRARLRADASRWVSARSDAAQAGGDRALIAAAASALVSRRDGRRAHRARRERTATRRWPRSSGCRTPSSRRASRRSTTSAGPRTTSSATTTRSRTPSAASRSPGRRARGGCSCR